MCDMKGVWLNLSFTEKPLVSFYSCASVAASPLGYSLSVSVKGLYLLSLNST